MRVFVVSIFLYLIFLLLGDLRNTINNTEETNVTYTKYTVKSIGQCKNDICSFIASDENGASTAAISKEPVVVGATVYNKCWTSIASGDTCGDYFFNKKPKAN